MAFQNVLPDPNNTIGDTGKATVGGAGPGYKSVSVTSKQDVMNERTNSGRLITRIASGHSWEVSIAYNPLTRAEFEPLNSFLLHKKGGLLPFFVSLPQNKVSQSIAFAKTVRPTTEAVGGVDGLGKEPLATHVPQSGGTFIVGQQYKITDVTGGTNWSSVGGSTSASVGQLFVATAAGTSALTSAEPTYTKSGADSILMSFDDYDLSDGHGAPKPGDFFTVDDDSDSNHTKMYQVVRTETRASYNDQPPLHDTDDTTRLYIFPPLQRNLYDGAKLVFHNPLMRVIINDSTQKYSLNNKNLYQISLKLQEAQK
jgi:hypothetical protein